LTTAQEETEKGKVEVEETVKERLEDEELRGDFVEEVFDGELELLIDPDRPVIEFGRQLDALCDLLVVQLVVERPVDEGVIDKGLKKRQETLVIEAHDVQSDVAASAEDSLDTSETKGVANVASETKGDRFRNREFEAFFKADVVIDVHELSCLLIEKDVVEMTVSQADDVPDDRHD
jgi:hypothetical protein